MPAPLRNLLAVLLGLLVGGAANMAVIQLNSSVLFPAPAGLNYEDTAAFQAYLDTLPATAFLVVMLAHLLQAGLGGWVAARVGASRPMVLALIVGGLSLAGGVMMMMQVQGPTWMYAELPGYLLVAWLAGRVEVRRRAAR